MSIRDFLKRKLKKPGGSEVRSDSDITGIRALESDETVSGVATQFDRTNRLAKRQQLVIGLDFGTAFTKVVIGETRFKLAVPLRGAGKNNSDYLLPTVFWSLPNGDCSINSSSGEMHTDIKMTLIEGRITTKSLTHAVVYLALVLRQIRAYLLTQKRDVYGDSYIDWLVNVGLPTQSYDDHTLNQTYQTIIEASWLLSTLPGPVNLNHAEELVTGLIDNAQEIREEFSEYVIEPEQISLFPEFVAQVAGYVRSPLRQPGLHILIDIGAGTVDMTIFNVHETEDEDKFPIFAKTVVPMGTRFLIKHRIHGTLLKEQGELAPYSPVPEVKRFSSILGISENKLMKIDEPFREKLIDLVTDLLRYTKNDLYPLSSRWEEGIPTFVCGGGSKCDFYENLFHPSTNRIREFKVRKMALVKSQEFQTSKIHEDDGDRLSVAYGLSFDPFDIGIIVIVDDDGLNSSKKDSTQFCYHCDGGRIQDCRYCSGSGFLSC